MEKSETICYKRRPVRIGVGVEAGVSVAQGGGEVELGDFFFGGCPTDPPIEAVFGHEQRSWRTDLGHYRLKEESLNTVT
jgi:hypothetical protein